MKWGLVLSGGVALGIANVGVLEVLEEEGLRPDCIAGSSMGAIIAALFALGFEAKKIHSIAKGLTLTNVALWNGLQGGLLQQNIARHLSPVIDDARIADCRIPFVCVAGFVRGSLIWKDVLHPRFAREWQSRVEEYVFPPRTRLINALMASSAVPILFSPVKIGRQTFIDLGNAGNIPSIALRRECHPDIVIGTDTAPRYSGLAKFCPPSIRAFIQQGEEGLARGRKNCDLLIEPEPAAPPFRFDLAEKFIEEGRVAAREALPRMRKILRVEEIQHSVTISPCSP
jgi:NTE family protein